MTSTLPLDHQLSLYDKTVSTDSGQYFCHERPFAAALLGNKVRHLPSGKDTLEAIHQALVNAEKFIWIADWQMAFDVELVDRGSNEHKGRLIDVFRRIIETKAVNIRVLLYESPLDAMPPYTYDGMVSKKINAINRPSNKGNIRVALQPATSGTGFSHHQKFVLVDGRVAFLGGIDLSYGRYSTPEFDVVIDPQRYVLNEMYSPCQPKRRGMSARESELVKQGFAAPYGKTLVEEGCQPRMPWQDVHIQLEGPSVVDVHRNFARRWNLWASGVGGERIDKRWLAQIGAENLLKSARGNKAGGAIVQIVRSVSARHLSGELQVAQPGRPDDLDLETAAVATVWEAALKENQGLPQDNILQAMVNCIRSADNYIYIETQFFISQFGQDRVGAGPKSSAEAGITNTVVPVLAERIAFHITAGTNFHVYLVIPVHPEGPLDDDSVWKQHWMALASISHGSESLINRIKRSLTSRNRSEDDWSRYLTVLNMRNYGVAVQYARDSHTFDEDFSREIGRYVITEQIYVHSKIMIVDDAVAIVGTANLNERSLSGTGDTEIAAVIVDTEDVRYEDLGNPGFKVHTRKFARELRKQLWKKHFGFSIQADRYFDSTARVPPSFAPVSIPEHPPRLQATEERINTGLDNYNKIPGVKPVAAISWQQLLDRPAHPDTVAAIQALALVGRKAYESVFTHIPRNDFNKFADGLSSFTQPYACAIGSGTTAERLKAEALFDRNRRRSLDASSSARSAQTRDSLDKFHEQQVREIERGTYGVVPAALGKDFMTRTLAPQQFRSGSARVSEQTAPSARDRYVTYEGGSVHDIKKTTDYLKQTVVGFWTLAPLDWGKTVTPVHFDTVWRRIQISRNEPVPNASAAFS